MANRDHVDMATRERWLPAVQGIALKHGWVLQGQALEQFVDQVAPYLAQPVVSGSASQISILHNYYNDAPLVNLLQAHSEVATILWSSIQAQVQRAIATHQLAAEQQVEMAQQIVGQMRATLANHTYQERVQTLLVAILHQVLADPAASEHYADDRDTDTPEERS